MCTWHPREMKWEKMTSEIQNSSLSFCDSLASLCYVFSQNVDKEMYVDSNSAYKNHQPTFLKEVLYSFGTYCRCGPLAGTR